jgi:hypothetical protein
MDYLFNVFVQKEANYLVNLHFRHTGVVANVLNVREGVEGG